jgi:hypothetical protein
LKLRERMPELDRELEQDLDYVSLFHKHLGISTREQRYGRPEDQPASVENRLSGVRSQQST